MTISNLFLITGALSTLAIGIFYSDVNPSDITNRLYLASGYFTLFTLVTWGENNLLDD